MTTFDWILVGSGAFDFIACVVSVWIASRLLATGGSVRFEIKSLAVVGVCAGVVIFAKTVGCVVLGVRIFGLIHLAYLDVSIVAPAFGMFILILHHLHVPGTQKIRFSKAVLAIAGLSILFAPICLYASYVEPFRLQVEQCSIPVSGINSPGEKIKIAVLSDLQFNKVTAYEHRAISMAIDAKPDIILLPGDVFQGTAREFDEQERAIRELFKPLRAPGGVYLVSGDCDPPNRLRRIVEGTDIEFVDNRIARTVVRGHRIAIAGVELRYASPAARSTIRALGNLGDGVDIKILFAHRPDVALQSDLPKSLDLIVAGHTHGGQVQIPGFGPPVTFSRVPRSVGAGGLHRLGNHNIYVSRGIGSERSQAPRIRLFCPPEVSILSLTALESPR